MLYERNETERDKTRIFKFHVELVDDGDKMKKIRYQMTLGMVKRMLG